MSPVQFFLLFLAAVLGSGMNAVAGGGSFFTFPMLLLTGVAPIAANATSTVALWPGTLASVAGYRDEVRHERRILLVFGLASVLGGLVGAFVLLGTPANVFRRLVPFLLLAATLIFAFGGVARRRTLGLPSAASEWEMPSGGNLWLLSLVQFAVAVYGGYFGGGMGFLLLAVYSVMGMTDVHAMNGLKVVLVALINGVAIMAFAIAGVIVWPVVPVMLMGSLAGGYGAARFARRVDPAKMRWFVVLSGGLLTAYFFAKG